MMQVLLAVHALLAIPLFWAIDDGNAIDRFFPDRPGLGSALAFVSWCFSWWMIARFRPMPRYQDQPETRFKWGPVLNSALIQVPMCAYIWFFNTGSGALLMIQFIVTLGLPMVLISWACARIRFHIGTWLLVWLAWPVASFVGIVAVLRDLRDM